MTRHLSLVLLAGMLLPTVPAAGQDVHPVPEGATVRFWAPEQGFKRTQATLLEWWDASVAFLPAEEEEPVLVPFQGLTELRVLAGKDRLKGAAAGVAIGGSVGMLAGLFFGNSAVAGCEGFLCGMEALNYAAAGGLIGAVLGLPIGISVAPDRWKRVDLPTGAGFPPYRRPFHKSLAFNLAAATATILITAAVSN